MKKVFLIILFLLPFALQADTFAVEVDTKTNSVNAIAGTLKLPLGSKVEEILTGNSAILIWLATPTFDEKARTISFAGLTPGGFKGRYPIFSVKVLGQSFNPTFSDVSAYKNDGEGNIASVSLSVRKIEEVEDRERPEPFKIIVSSSPDVFEGRNFISFAAQDKGTGINKYEFASTWLLNPGEGDWSSVQSPRTLSRAESLKRLHVRATDASGNERTVSTGGPYWPFTLLFGLIILLCVLSLLRRSFRSRFS